MIDHKKIGIAKEAICGLSKAFTKLCTLRLESRYHEIT